MGRRTEPIIGREEMAAAFRQAAHDAVHGTREQRSGRFLGQQPDWARWDRQIARDVEAAKPDKPLEEAKGDYEAGRGKRHKS